MMSEVVQFHSLDAIPVAYLLAKSVEKEFLLLRESILKESLPTALNSSHSKGGEDAFLIEITEMINLEIQELSQSIRYFESILSDAGISSD